MHMDSEFCSCAYCGRNILPQDGEIVLQPSSDGDGKYYGYIEHICCDEECAKAFCECWINDEPTPVDIRENGYPRF